MARKPKVNRAAVDRLLKTITDEINLEEARRAAFPSSRHTKMKELTGKILPDIFRQINERLPQKSRRPNGCLWALGLDGFHAFTVTVGQAPANKVAKTENNAGDIAISLCAGICIDDKTLINFKKDSGPLSCGAAIRWDQLALAFAGLPIVTANEAVAIEVARHQIWLENNMEPIESDIVKKIVQTSKNPYIEKL